VPEPLSLLDYAKLWQEKLEHCHYVGEIYVDQETFKKLAIQFWNQRDELRKIKLYETALLVLAANCAYHFYDDSGFWCHFCEYTNIDETEQEMIGRSIEKKLESLGMLKKRRTGPFRYVGSILEQCGVSRRHIATLGRIIRMLRDASGWDSLISMSHFEFQNCLDDVACSKYLKNFLADEAGWKFTMDICHLAMLYEEGTMTIEELKELPGYQPDFWDEFLSHFEVRGVQGTHRGIFRPRIVFLADERCLAILFPGQNYISDITHPRIEGGWKYPLTRLDRNELLSSHYSGTVVNESGQFSWHIDGWMPDGQPALFDLKRGYITRGSNIYPGEYYMLVPREYDLVGKKIREIGDASVPNILDYKAYWVSLNAGDVVPGYVLSDYEENDDVTLNWLDPERYKSEFIFVRYPDVFIGMLPDIHISSTSAIDENRVGIFYDIGNGIRRLRKRDDIQIFREEICRRAPVEGRIWLSDIARSSIGRRAISELEFYLIKKCVLKFDDRTYGCDEEAVIFFEADQGCQLDLPECKQKIDGGGSVFLIPANISVAEGRLSSGTISVAVRVPVYRARISCGGRQVRYISVDEIRSIQSFLISGYPDSEADVRIAKNTMVSIHLRFDTYGMARFEPDLLLSWQPDNSGIGEVVICHSGHEGSTGMVIIDLEILQTMIYGNRPFEIGSLPTTNLKNIVGLLKTVVRGSSYPIFLKNLPNFSPEIDRWILTMLACASIIDKREITLDGQSVDWVKKIDGGVREVLSCFKNDSVKSEDDLDIRKIPDVDRWRGVVTRFLHRHSKEGRLDILRDWSDDVRLNRVPYRSGIAVGSGGNALCRAWHHYLASDFSGANEILIGIARGSSIVMDLKRFLRVFLLLRTNRIESAIEESSHDMENREMTPILTVLSSAISGIGLDNIKDDDLDLLSILPLSMKDVEFLRQTCLFRRDRDGVVEYCLRCDDWLLIWTVIKLLKSGDALAALSEKLIGIRETIPASPDRGKMLDYIYKNYRRS
jgi:hypothetical protein